MSSFAATAGGPGATRALGWGRPANTARSRGSDPLRQPASWAIALALAGAAAVAMRGPLSSMLGTGAQLSAGTTTPVGSSPDLMRIAELVPVPYRPAAGHVRWDPFHALAVAGSGTTTPPTGGNPPSGTGATAIAGGTSASSGSGSPTSPAPTTASQSTVHYTVRPGDSLWLLAERITGPTATTGQLLSVEQQIYADNRAVIGSNPNLLATGVVLVLPQR